MSDLIDFEIKSKALQANGELIISGIASSNEMDRQGEAITITPNALKLALPRFFAIGSPIKVEHEQDTQFGDKTVGRVLSMDYTPKEYNVDTAIHPKMKIDAVCVITDPEAIKLILNGTLGSFSMRWRATKTPGSILIDPRNPSIQVFKDMEIVELTICRIPVNPEAKFTIVTNQSLIKQYGFAERIGNEVESYSQMGKVKAYFIRDNQAFYEMDFDKIKGVYIPVEEIKKVKTIVKPITRSFLHLRDKRKSITRPFLHLRDKRKAKFI